MKQLNRIKVVLVEQNRTAKWLSEQIGKKTCSVSRWCTTHRSLTSKHCFVSLKF